MTGPLGFPKNRKVKKASEFTRAFREGSVAANDTLVLIALPSQLGKKPNLGITIPRRVGNAVVRNRWKRHIREAFRICQSDLPTGFDFIVRPKKNAIDDWSKIRDGFVKLASRATKRSSSC